MIPSEKIATRYAALYLPDIIFFLANFTLSTSWHEAINFASTYIWILIINV